jgi:hypothetical protein
VALCCRSSAATTFKLQLKLPSVVGKKRKMKEEINFAKAEAGKQSSSIVFVIIAWCCNNRAGN